MRFDGKTVAVTGAGGFIASHLAGDGARNIIGPQHCPDRAARRRHAEA